MNNFSLLRFIMKWEVVQLEFEIIEEILNNTFVIVLRIFSSENKQALKLCMYCLKKCMNVQIFK